MWCGQRLLVSALSLTIGLVGCSSGSDGDPETADSPIVSEQTFDKAFATVRGIDYLPFGFPADGCYARAQYMSMELAAKGIESNSVFLLADEGGPQPHIAGASWGYHVAPVIEVRRGSTVEPTVVDPVVSAAPLTVESWVSAMGVTPKEVHIALLKGAQFGDGQARNLVGSAAQFREELTASFADMPRFDMQNILVSCMIAHEYLYADARNLDALADPRPDRPVVSDADARAIAAPRRARLLTRTKELVSTLARLGKLDTSRQETFDEPRCASKTYATEGR